MKFISSMVAGIILGVATIGTAGAQGMSGGGIASAEPSYLSGALEIGLRVSYFTFRDPTQKSGTSAKPYQGYTPGISIFSLYEEQNYMPYPYLRYNINPYFGIQLGWENIEGRTRTRDEITGELYSHSDGNPQLEGPSLLLYGRLPLEDRVAPFDALTPYVGVGVVIFSGDFKHNADWHNNGQRNIAVDDTTGFLATLGISVEVIENLGLDLSFSYLSASPDAKFWLRGDRQPRAEWEFPMDSWVFQFGAKFLF